MEIRPAKRQDKVTWRTPAVAISLIAIIIWFGYWRKLAQDNMSGLIDREPHSRLVRVELHSGPAEAVKPILSKIDDKASLDYLDTYRRPTHSEVEKSVLGTLRQIDATFIFADWSRYRTTLTIPNHPDQIRIRFPADGFFAFDDHFENDRYFAVDPKKTRDLDVLFRWANGY